MDTRKKGGRPAGELNKRLKNESTSTIKLQAKDFARFARVVAQLQCFRTGYHLQQCGQLRHDSFSSQSTEYRYDVLDPGSCVNFVRLV